MKRIGIGQTSKAFYSGHSGLVLVGDLINGYIATVHRVLLEADPARQSVRSASYHFPPGCAMGHSCGPGRAADPECQETPFGRILTYEMGSVRPETGATPGMSGGVGSTDN